MGEPIGAYLCDNCGSVPIEDSKKVLIIFPKGIDLPIAKVNCDRCGMDIVSRIPWEEAILFDKAGANVQGYSFVRGKPITQEDIDAFMSNFDEELSGFLDESKL